MRTQFYNRDGSLSRYALACGYVERSERENVIVTMYQEHSVYHVRAFDHADRGRLAWKVFSTVTAARTYYRRAVKMFVSDGAE